MSLARRPADVVRARHRKDGVLIDGGLYAESGDS
jgi:hypothetical protein